MIGLLRLFNESAKCMCGMMVLDRTINIVQVIFFYHVNYLKDTYRKDVFFFMLFEFVLKMQSKMVFAVIEVTTPETTP